jgi:hypothetical protein
MGKGLAQVTAGVVLANKYSGEGRISVTVPFFKGDTIFLDDWHSLEGMDSHASVCELGTDVSVDMMIFAYRVGYERLLYRSQLTGWELPNRICEFLNLYLNTPLLLEQPDKERVYRIAVSTQRQLANLVGISREHLNRHIRELEVSGRIRRVKIPGSHAHRVYLPE